MEKRDDLVNKGAYLDNHTSSRPCPLSLERMLPFLHDHFSSPHSPHEMGQELIYSMNLYLETLYKKLGASEKDLFYFFGSPHEGLLQMFLSHYFANVQESGKNHLLVCNNEESAIVKSIEQLKPLGCILKMMPVNQYGQLTKEILLEHLKPRVSLLSISYANGLTGAIQPISDLAQACKEKGIKLHVDVTYALGKLYFHTSDLNADYLTFDGEKVHATKGTFALFSKESVSTHYLFTNTAGLASLSSAIENASMQTDHLCMEIATLRDKLENGIQEHLPNTVIHFQEAERLPNVSVMSFPGASSDSLLYLLQRKEVYATNGEGALSSQLAACGIESSLRSSAVSFSLSYETTEEEIDNAIEAIVSTVQKLQNLSAHL